MGFLGSKSNTSDNEKAPIDRVDSVHGEVIDLRPEQSVDMAAQFIDKPHEPLTEAASRRIKWKADLYICTLLASVYAIQFMDKVSNSSASVMGLRTDLDMKGQMYSWVGSSFYLSYLIFEIPMSIALQKFPLAKATGVFIVAWGLILALSSASQNYPGYIVTRVLLGAFEGAVTPSFVILTSQWYKRNEQFSRTCIWFGFNGIGSLLGSAIAYGLYERHLDGALSMSGWRILFIVLGVITITLGIVFFFHVPDTPAQAWFLTKDERVQQVERIRENMQGFGNTHVKWYQVRETFIDPRTYLYFVIVVMNNIPNGGLTNFQALLFSGMGYNSARSLIMAMPAGAVEAVGCFSVGILSMYIWNNRRMYWACSGAGLNVAVLCLLAWGPNNGCKLAGIYLNTFFQPISYIGLLSCISSNSAGHTKKVLMGAILLVGYCVGNLIGPQTFKAAEAPGYQTAKTCMAACSVVAFVFEVGLFFLNKWENARRDRKNEKLPPHIENPEFADLTDFENPEFRYAL